MRTLALGVREGLVGRPIFWGLAVGGEAGVMDVLNILGDEIEMTTAMCGRPAMESIAA